MRYTGVNMSEGALARIWKFARERKKKKNLETRSIWLYNSIGDIGIIHLSLFVVRSGLVFKYNVELLSSSFVMFFKLRFLLILFTSFSIFIQINIHPKFSLECGEIQ